ncbi:amidase [Spectribacter hydrogenoxidans]|uniref:Amidase n=1 Tax=Spectribacter hydrogenoxidans TaxID=3075608 RepID=A0ABU3C390_9GAMM|nr:amidase [Salinisphaera sp. W335]MDT0636016.1 amidase [Salinisphaera sp. W335]
MASDNLDLCYLSATEALAAFQAKELSPVEVLQAQIDRIESVNNTVNALTDTYFDRALELAKAAETRYAKGADVRPLEGLSCGIKDWHSVEGEITTYGSRVFADYRPDQTAPTVERLLDAGAIMHCRTTTPEFAHSGVTHTPLWGVTRNPWNPDYTPGGSSGGSGAALAAGMATIADGTDGGGSLRIPAAMSGLFGYKPPFGRNPLDREHPGETLLHYGAMTRSVADLALLQNVMSGVHPADHYSLRERIILPKTFDSAKGLKIGLSMDLGYYRIDSQVRENTNAAARTLQELGCDVDEVRLGWDTDTDEGWLTTWEGLFWALAGELLTDSRDQLDPFVVQILERGREHSLKSFYNVHQLRFGMYQKLARIFQDYDLLICPTTATASVKADQSNFESVIVEGEPVRPYIGWFLTYPFNLLSACPVMSVPTGFADTGVPTGMQIVGRPYDDETVFRAAAALEAATSPWKSKRPDI